MHRWTWVIGFAAVSVGVASLGADCGNTQPPPVNTGYVIEACADEGQEIQIQIEGAEECGYQGAIKFTGGATANGVKPSTTIHVTVPVGAKSGPIDLHQICPSIQDPPPTITIPCGPDASPPDAGDGGGGDAGACTNDGTCASNESCACADCKSQARCGAGCTPVTVTDFNPMNANFVDGKVGPIDGPLQDNIQAFFKSGAGLGDESLTLPTMQAECGGGLKTCIQVVTENFSGKRYIQTSGNMNLTQTGPFKGSLSDVVLYPRMNLPDGGITADFDGGCVYIQLAKIPTIDGG